MFQMYGKPSQICPVVTGVRPPLQLYPEPNQQKVVQSPSSSVQYAVEHAYQVSTGATAKMWSIC